MPEKKFFNWLVYSLLFLVLFFLSAILTSQYVLRGETAALPDLSGKTLEEARKDLGKKNLSVALKGVQFDDRWPRGRIIFQDPAAGSKVKVNKVVRVIMSGGSEKVAIPKLIGKSLEAASLIIKDSGLTKGKITQVHTSQYPAGRILAQQPPPLQLGARNTPLGLLVSQGEREEKYLMPDLIGRKSERVIAKLKEMNFQVADVRYSYYPGLESGIVIKQFPLPGFRIQKRNLISLEVSK